MPNHNSGYIITTDVRNHCSKNIRGIHEHRGNGVEGY